MISDALWNEIARALQACYPERAPAMLRELEKDRNVAQLIEGSRVDASLGNMRGSFICRDVEIEFSAPTQTIGGGWVANEQPVRVRLLLLSVGTVARVVAP